MSSRCSQILALLQSRLTVTGETLSTMAVSSMLRPPKNRISRLHFARVDARECVQRVVEGELVSVAPGTEQLADIVDRQGCRFRGAHQ